MSSEHHVRPSVAQRSGAPARGDRGAAALGTVASIGALFSAAACCVVPLALAAIGVSSAGLASVVPFHWPLTIAAVVVVAIGWFFYLRRRQACARDVTCTAPPPARSTFILLSLATLFVTISVCWPWIEAPLMRALGGA